MQKLVYSTEAINLISDKITSFPIVDCPLEKSAGRILRGTIIADRDIPPFDRAMMDGIALSYISWKSGLRSFKIRGLQAAGGKDCVLSENDTAGCLEIMTGASLPSGCDCIIPIEDVIISDGVAHVTDDYQPSPDQYVHSKGIDHVSQSVLLTHGCILGSREIAVAASCGYTILPVSAIPRISLIATGDELIPVNMKPEVNQIRISNQYAMNAALQLNGYMNNNLIHLRDNFIEVKNGLEESLRQSDWIILSGGVSEGKHDFIPEVLQDMGVSPIFQGVRQRPGKPFGFWMTTTGKPVFTLPGNPLSTLITFHRYVLPALRESSRQIEPAKKWVLLQELLFSSSTSTQFLPVIINDDYQAEPKLPKNSGDYTAVIGTDGFIELPSEKNKFPVDYKARFFPWDL